MKISDQTIQDTNDFLDEILGQGGVVGDIEQPSAQQIPSGNNGMSSAILIKMLETLIINHIENHESTTIWNKDGTALSMEYALRVLVNHAINQYSEEGADLTAVVKGLDARGYEDVLHDPSYTQIFLEHFPWLKKFTDDPKSFGLSPNPTPANLWWADREDNAFEVAMAVTSQRAIISELLSVLSNFVEPDSAVKIGNNTYSYRQLFNYYKI